MQQIKIIYSQDEKCVIDSLSTHLNADVLAKHLHRAYSEVGVEVLAINKVEEVEIGIL